MNWMFVEFERIGYFASMSLFNTDSLMTMEASFVKSTDLALLLFECLVIRMKVNKI